jgi:hypothetical protein
MGALLAVADIATEGTERTENQGVEKTGARFLMIFSVTSVFSVVQLLKILIMIRPWRRELATFTFAVRDLSVKPRNR